jgi:hypothetical protein
MFANMASDDAKPGGGPGDDPELFVGFEHFAMQTDNNLIEQLWARRYEGISYCNILIDYTTAGSSDEIDQYRAEAYFMRAFFYFDLVRLFGGVPLFLSANDPVKPELGRSTAEEVYAQIESDLLLAIPDFPLKSAQPADQKYRISKGAAQSLLGKIYLYEEKWTEAVNQLEAVINSGQYNLLAKFSDLWVTANKFNAESILEFPYSSTEASYNNNDYNYNAMCMGARTINDNVSIFKRGWGLCPVTQDLVDAYLAENDTVRLKATVIDEDTLINSGCTLDMSDVNSDYTGYYDFKHTALTADFQPGSMFSDKNEIVIRYADVLLMCAEALFQSGNESEAQDYLNMVRSRANLPNVTATGAALFEAICKERRLELALEGNRFNDLIRWGQAEEVLSSLGYASNNNVWPIPEKEIYKNSNLTQNIGYVYTGEEYTFEPSGYNSGKYFDSYKNGLDSIVMYQYNFAAADSLPNTSLTFSKRTNRVIDAKFSIFDINTDKWLISGCAVDSLDNNGMLLSETQYGFNHSKSTQNVTYWDTLYKYVYTYNSGGYPTSQALCRWVRMKIGGVYVNLWLPNYRNLLFPDNYGNDTLNVTLSYNPTTNSYSTFSKGRFEHTYGSNGRPDSTVYYQSGFTPDTLNYTKGYKDVYTYDAIGNVTQKDHFVWTGSAYELGSSYKNIYEYNSDDAIVSNVYQSLNNETDLYDNSQKDVFILDDINRTKVLSRYTWHIGFEDWWIGDGKYRSYYYYGSSVQVEYPLSENTYLNIWPNPVSSDIVNLDYRLETTGDIQLLIYSMEGKMVENFQLHNQYAGENHSVINISQLSKGLYTIKVISGSLQYVRKLVVTK